MAGESRVGLIYVELDLDTSRFMKSQQTLLKDAKSTALNLEENFNKVGIKSDATFDLMRQKAANAYEKIATDARSSAADIVRAEQAKADRMKAIYNEQNAHIAKAQNELWGNMGIRSTAAIEAQRTAVMSSYASLTAAAKGNQQELINLERAKNDQLKKLNAEMVGEHEMSMASMTRAVLRFYAAYYVVSTVFSAVSSAIMSGIKAIDEFKVSTIAVAAQITSLQGNNNVAENYKNALAYAEKLNLKLMEIDANSFANFQQIQLMNRAMATHGVILDTNNKKQIESFTAITNTIALLTTGQNKEIQASQEMNALMTGRAKATDRVAMMIDGIIKQEGIYKNGLAEVVALGKQHGDTIQRLYPYFSGIIAASGDISKTWESIGSSLETVWGIVQRGLFKDMYKSLVTNGREIAEWTRKNADKIIEQINRAYDTVAYMIKGMIILLGAFAAVSVTKFFIAGGAATAWGKAVEIAGTQATLALSKVKLAFGGFATFIMGYSIGTWLMDEFESVRLFGVAMVQGLIDTWEWAKKTFEMFVEAIKNPFASQEETMDRNAAINAKYEKEQAARNAIFLQMAEESTNAYKKTLAERKKAEADAIIKTPDIPPPPPEKTRTATKDHSDMLKTMREDNKHYYEDAINQAKAAAETSQKAGQNELVTIDTLLNARLDALTERKRREEEMARLEVQYASEANDAANKNAEAGAEKTMYDAKAVLAAKFHSIEIGFITDANKAEADAGLKREGYYTKNAETIAKLYHTIDQYSDESLKTQIDALKLYYTQSQRWVEATTEGRLLIETAEAEAELKLRRDNEQAKYNLALDYLADTEGAYSKTSRAIYELSLKNQAEELASKMKSNMIVFDQTKWIAEQRFKYENENERKIYDLKLKYLTDMGLEYTKTYRDLSVARIKNEADALEKEFQKAAGASGMSKEQQDQITAEQDLTQKLMTEWEERLRAYADYLKGMGDKEGSDRALKAAEDMANKKIALQNKVKDNAVEAQQTMFDKAAWTNKKIQDLDINTAKSYIGNIGNMLDAAMSMYDTESSEYARMAEWKKGIQIAQIALDQVKNIQTIAGYLAVRAAASSAAVANAGAAVAGAAIGVGPTGFVTAAAMIALMAGVFSMYGIAASGGSPSLPAPAATTYQGASGRLGAETGVGSESIENSIELLQETYDMQSTKLTRIYEEMRDLNRNITGLITSIVRTGGIQAANVQTGYTESPYTTAFDSNPLYSNELNNIWMGVGGLSLMGDLLGAMFGGDTEKWVSAIGIAFGEASVQSILDGIPTLAQAFTVVSTQTSGGLFSSGSFSQEWIYEELDAQVIDAINMIYKSMADTLIYIGEGLGANMQDVYDYVFKEQSTPDMLGMSTEEMNTALNEYFSTMMDTAVYDLFGELLLQYQKIDEGLTETAIRLIRDKEVILSMLEMTGQSFVGTEEKAIALSQSLITLAGDLETLADAANVYYENFTTDAEKQADLTRQLNEVMTEMNMVLPDTRDGYAELVALMAATMDTTTEAGMAAQENYVALLMLADASDKYYTTLEDAQQTIDDTIVYYQDMMGLTSALGSEIDDVTEYFEKAYEAAVLLGASEENLAALRQAEVEIIDKLIADYLDSYSDWVGSTTGTTSEVQTNLQSIIDYYDQMEADLLAIGAAQDVIVELHRQEQAVLEYTANVIMADMLTTMMEINGYSTQLSTDLRYIAESYSKMLQDAYQLVSMDLASPMSMAVIAASGGIAILNRLNKSRTEQEQANINSVADASQARYDAESEEIKKLTSQIQDLESIIDAVVNKIQDLKYSQFNLALPAQKMPQAAEDYQALLDAAKTGDAGAVNKYLGFVDTYLQTAQDRYKSSAEYQAIYRQVMEDLEGVKASAQKQLTLDQQLLMEINSKMGEIAGSSGSTASNTAAIAEQETVLNNIAASMLGAAEFLEEFVGKYLETMPVIAGLAQLIADKMTSMADLLHDIQKYITDGMNNGFAADGFITGLINSMIAEIGSGLLNIGELLTSAGFGNIGAVLTSIGSKMDTQINNYSELVQWLKDLNEKGATLVYFGEMMVYYGFTDLGNKIVELGTKLSTMGAAISKPLAALKDAMTGWITVKQITDQDIFDSLNFGNKTVAGWAYDTSVNAYHTAYGVAALNSSLKVPGYSEGGIASGPESGYPVILHGTEAITPINKMSAGRGAGLGEDPEVKQILTNILAAQNKKQRVTIVLDNGRELSGYVKSIADGLDQTRYDKQVLRRTYR